MSHYAQLINNVVIQVIVYHDLDASGAEIETLLAKRYGEVWKQTSYHGTIRGRFAGIGFTYDPVLDVFIPPESGNPEPPMPVNEV